jgi:serine/threonine-protein kinase
MAAVAPDLKTLGRYNIERTLGTGAMGVVYEGVDPRLGRRVAIKTILKSHLDEETARDYSMRFVREAQAVARLNHPNIVQVYDFGEEGDIAYLVMEFIKGKELKNFFDANERFDLKEAVRIMCELCDALDFAHNAGIIHRDIKPANVMIDAQARTKLTDFGVARVQDSDKTSVERTQAGTMVGTPAYMSPEQITGGNIDKRSDVFSAGIILYQFLTGEKPFTGSGAWTIAKKIIQEEPPLPSSLNNAITPLFDAVVNRVLAKNPDQRFQSARDLAVALRRALEGKPIEDDSDRTVVGGLAMDSGLSRPAPAVAKAPAHDSARTSNTNTQGNSQEVELEFWRAIKEGNDPDDFELYVQQFPNGIYAKLAKRKIAKLRGLPVDDESTAKAKEQEKKETEEAARREAEVKAKLEAEKARLEAEMARKEEEYRKREAEAEAKRQAAEQARIEAEERARKEAAQELARREAQAKAKAEAEARAREEAEKKAREEFARREAELKKRVAAAEAAPGGKRQSIKYAAIVGTVVLAIAAVVIFVLPKEDPEAAAKLRAVQEQLEQTKKKAAELEQAKKKEEEARVALEKVRKAQEEARKAGDKTKEKELAEARKAAEAEAKVKADATRAKEQEKLAADAKAKDGDSRKTTERAAQDRALAEKLAAERAAAEKAAAEAKAAADKLAVEKAALEAERARIEKAKLTTLQPASAGSAGAFQVAQGLEKDGRGKDAVKAYIAAARGGSCESAKRLGDIYDKGLIGVSRDYAESLRWYGFARALGTCEVPSPARR